MRAKIDVSEVETATKIRAKYLRAMENEEWGLLPGPTFVKSFLRTYADYLGVDGKLLVDEYKLRHEPPVEQELQPIGPGLGNNERRRLRAPAISRGWAIGLSIAGVLGLLILLGSLSEQPQAPIPAPATTPARRAPRRATPPTPTRVALRLVPAAPVYVCLRNAQDELLLNETLQPGSEPKTYRSKRFRLTMGNNSIDLRVNGKTVSVRPSSGAITYVVTPAGRRDVSDTENACEG